MSDQVSEINPVRGDDIHQTAHPFFAAGAQGGDDVVVA